MISRPVQASVIVAALNAADYIEQQLLALARQRAEVTWELILADDGSTDATRAIVDRCASDFPVPLRVLDASERPGVSAARNVAVAAAAGEFLLFTDADDVVDEVWVQEMVRALGVHPFVGGKLEILELNGEEVASRRPTLFADGLPDFGGRPWVMGCNFGCKASAFKAIGGFQEKIPGWDDVDLSMVMNAHGMTAVFAERAIVHYRYRQDPRQTVRQQVRPRPGSEICALRDRATHISRRGSQVPPICQEGRARDAAGACAGTPGRGHRVWGRPLSPGEPRVSGSRFTDSSMVRTLCGCKGSGSVGWRASSVRMAKRGS